MVRKGPKFMAVLGASVRMVPLPDFAMSPAGEMPSEIQIPSTLLSC